MTEEMKQQEGGGDSIPDPNPNPNPNPCPICLGFITHDAYLDRCFHRYCYQCIVRWTEVVSSRSSSSRKPTSVKCPLCKTENSSIIYGYDGCTFQRHFINQNNSNSAFFTQTHKYRLQCYYTEPGLLRDTFNVARYWKTRRYLQPSSWLETWLTRELQALTQEEDVDIIMHHIHGVIVSFSRRHDPKGSAYAPEQKQKEFKSAVGDAARPFLMARTERFVDEVELFLASGLTVEAYDRAYRRCLGWLNANEVSKDADTTSSDHEPISPYLHFLDDDAEDTNWAQDIHE